MSRQYLSVIIVHYQSLPELLACLTSLHTEQQTCPFKFEIIIVDNDPKSLDGQIIQNQFPDILYFRSKRNRGFGAGNNAGAKIAKGKFLFFLNPDTLIEPHAIKNLISVYQSLKNPGAVAPLLLTPKGKPYPLQGTQRLTPIRAIVVLTIFNKIFPSNVISQAYWLHGWNKKKLQEVNVVPGTAFLIRKDIFKKINGFDKEFFLYFEEHDFCDRLVKAGYHNFITPLAKVVHLWGVTTATVPNTKQIYFTSQLYYMKKHYGTFWAYLVYLAMHTGKKEILGIFPFILLLLYIGFVNR